MKKCTTASGRLEGCLTSSQLVSETFTIASVQVPTIYNNMVGRSLNANQVIHHVKGLPYRDHDATRW